MYTYITYTEIRTHNRNKRDAKTVKRQNGKRPRRTGQPLRRFLCTPSPPTKSFPTKCP